MPTFMDLPVDCLIHILYFLPYSDIEKCKLVSRTLYSTISDCLPLQYKIILDHLGFAATQNTGHPSLEFKVRALREKRIKWEQRKLEQSAAILLEKNIRIPDIQCSRGSIIATNTPITVPLSIQLHRLASPNRGVDYHYSLTTDQSGIIASSNWIKVEAALDLLVIIEYINNTDLRFHLRSLRTGSPHPGASHSTIVSRVADISFPGVNTRSIEIVDRRIVHLGESISRSTPLLTAWDWATGKLVTSTSVPGHYYAFISEDIFIVATGQTRFAGEYALLSLSVFTLEGVPLGEAARFVASLCLPTTEGPSYPFFELYHTPPIPIHKPHESHKSAQIFDLDETSHYLALRLTIHPTGDAWVDSTGILFVHTLGLRMLTERLASTRQSPVFVRWDNWGFMTCWLKVMPSDIWRCIYGHRAAFLRLDPATGDCEVVVYDLRVTRRGRLRQKAVDSSAKSPLEQQTDRLFNVKGKTTRHPTIASTFWIGPDVIPKGQARKYDYDLKMDDEHGKLFVGRVKP